MSTSSTDAAGDAAAPRALPVGPGAGVIDLKFESLKVGGFKVFLTLYLLGVSARVSVFYQSFVRLWYNMHHIYMTMKANLYCLVTASSVVRVSAARAQRSHSTHALAPPFVKCALAVALNYSSKWTACDAKVRKLL